MAVLKIPSIKVRIRICDRGQPSYSRFTPTQTPKGLPHIPEAAPMRHYNQMVLFSFPQHKKNYWEKNVHVLNT